MIDQEELFAKLNADGLKSVKKKIAQGVYSQSKLASIQLWIAEQEEQLSIRTWMYHEFDAPKGQIFERRDVPALEKHGWVDTPAKFGLGVKSKARRIGIRAKSFWNAHWKWIISGVVIPIILALIAF